MALTKKGKIIIAVVVWGMLAMIGSVGYRYFIKPKAEENAREEMISSTTSQSRYKHKVSWLGDWFSGYAGYRSQSFINECASRSIKVNMKDDGADYGKRLQALATGEADMAVFTIDAFTKAISEYGNIDPATIVWISDVSYGADAIVVNKSTFPNVDALNHVDTKFVVIPDSPSETLALVVMDHFKMDKLSKDPWVYANSPKEIYEMYRNSKPADKLAFVLWEPFITKVLENQQYHKIIDSSKFKNYIVDVAVASRDFLAKNRDLVTMICESYFSGMYDDRGKLVDIIMKDADLSGETLTKDQAKNLTTGILFKNTQENYTHFGMRSGNLQHIESIIEEIIRLQLKAGVIQTDPTNGSPNVLYYNEILGDMFNENFHPGLSSEDVREDKQLPKLSDEEWATLKPVGTLQVPRLQFRRGTSRLSPASEKILNDLKSKLEKWPQYYLIVQGNASSQGDLDANMRLAENRAKASVQWLVENGVNPNRIQGKSSEPNGSTTVSFVLGEVPY